MSQGFSLNHNYSFKLTFFGKVLFFRKYFLEKIPKVKNKQFFLKTPVTLCGQTYNKYILKISGQMESPFLRDLRSRSRKTCMELIKFKNYLRYEIKINATKNNLNMSISSRLSLKSTSRANFSFNIFLFVTTFFCHADNADEFLVYYSFVSQNY